jgi:putative ABC transport system permease protein
METILKDVRYGVRMLVRNPGFTFVAVAALALGIGANAAIFSVVNAVLLRPLPYDNPDRLMMIRETKLPQFPEFSVSPGNFLEWQKQNKVFERMVAIRNSTFNLLGAGEPERLRAMRVTDGFLSILGERPEIGRDFLPEEDQLGHNQVVIISNGLWQRRFGGEKNILGRTIVLDGQIYTVIGVMKAAFRFQESTMDLWMPMAFTSDQTQEYGGHYLQALGRLKAGASVEQARLEMSAIADRLAEQHPDQDKGWGVKIMPLPEFTVHTIKPALLVLLGAVSFVLLIACANVANLLLARAATRQKEIGIRTALGAGRWRIVRQLLTESVLLSLLGGAAGLLLAMWGMPVLLSLAPQDLLRVNDITLDSRVLIFTFVAALLTGVIFGLVPAIQASVANPNEILKEAGRGSTEGGQRQFVRSALVVFEIAMALVLLVGAGLMIKSFQRLQKVDPGFNAENALTVEVSLPERKYPKNDQQSAFYTQLIDKVSTLPGAQSVAATNVVPLSGNDFVLGFDIKGSPLNTEGDTRSTNYYAVSADYFNTMGIRILKGRSFTAHDTKDSPRVAIINETMARKFFPGEDPIGRFINVTFGPTSYREIVGIASDVKQYSLDQETTMQTYEPYTQTPFPSMTLVVHAKGDPSNLSSIIRRSVLELDKDQPVSGIKTLAENLSASLAQQRFAMLLLVVFAFVAMMLAGVGIYGVMSYSITQRTHEIGIRRALGASTRDVLKLVVGHGMILTLIGLMVGLSGAFALTRLMNTLLFGVSATDVTTFAFFSVSLTIVAVVACLVPALRALKVDPMTALRYE